MKKKIEIYLSQRKQRGKKNISLESLKVSDVVVSRIQQKARQQWHVARYTLTCAETVAVVVVRDPSSHPQSAAKPPQGRSLVAASASAIHAPGPLR
jgi:hypothetical protein